MKLITLISATAASATAFAGEPAPVQVPAPAPAPALGSWFVGASFGQFDSDSALQGYANDPDVQSLQDFEFDMYTLHVGRDLDRQFLGCDLAAYFEIGYLDGNASISIIDSSVLQFANFDLEIIPITINLKAERTLFAGIKGYATVGIGYAFAELKVRSNALASGSARDEGFYAQASLGLAYDINDDWEIYGGARWLYFGEIDIIGSDGLDLDDGIAYEIGVRYHF